MAIHVRTSAGPNAARLESDSTFAAILVRGLFPDRNVNGVITRAVVVVKLVQGIITALVIVEGVPER